MMQDLTIVNLSFIFLAGSLKYKSDESLNQQITQALVIHKAFYRGAAAVYCEASDKHFTKDNARTERTQLRQRQTLMSKEAIEIYVLLS